MSGFARYALVAALSSGATAAVGALSDVSDVYRPLTSEDVAFVAVEPRGSCPDAGGAPVGDGQCWNTYATVKARPSRDGLPVLQCDVRAPTAAAEMTILKGMIKSKVLAACAVKHGLQVAP